MRPRNAARWAGRLVPVALTLLVGSLLPAGRAAAATLTVSPTSAPILSLRQFTVDGAGFGLYEVHFNGVNVGQLVGDVDSGVYHAVFPVPAPGKAGAAKCGANRVDLVDSTVVDVSPDAVQATATITAVCASITVSPNPSVTPGQPRSVTYHVTPKDFPVPGAAPDLSVYQLTVDDQPQPITGSPADVVFTAALACGTHRVRLAEVVRVTLAEATTNLVVSCARISLAPATIRRSDEPTTISVAGTGFNGGRVVRYGLANGPTSSGPISATGLFELPLPVSGLDCGVYQVQAIETVGLTTASAPPLQASAPLTVTGCPTPPGGRPTVRVDPGVVQVGMTTHVTGSGFTPGQPVTLAWVMLDGSPLPGDCTTNADPTGTVDTYCLVLPHGLLGARALVATQGGLTARATAVVDGGTAQPGGSDDQLLFRR